MRRFRLPRLLRPAPVTPAPAAPVDRRCLDCGRPGTEQVATLPRVHGAPRPVFASRPHAARHRI